MIIPDIVEQHWEEAGLLWSRRCSATAQASFALRSLSQLDERVEAHLDGLRVAGKEAWELCLDAAAWEDGGEAFVMGMLSFADADEARFGEVTKHAVASPALARGLTSALGWSDASVVQSKIHALLMSESAVKRRVGLGAAALHRLRLNGPLMEALKDSDELLRARACKAVGELGRSDLMRYLQPSLAAGGAEACIFWASWSLALMAPDGAALERLRDFVTAGSVWQMRAADVLFRRWSHGAAMDFQQQLSTKPECARLAVTVAGIIGDPRLIPWLLDQMDNPERVRLAAEAFQTITGADFVMDRLRNSTPPRPPVLEDSGGDQPSDPRRRPDVAGAESHPPMVDAAAGTVHGGYPLFAGEADYSRVASESLANWPSAAASRRCVGTGHPPARPTAVQRRRSRVSAATNPWQRRGDSVDVFMHCPR